MGLICSTKRSITMMCAAQKNDPISSTASPQPAGSRSLMHKRYNPTTAHAAPNQVSRLVFRRNNIRDAMGTIIMYNPVINPAFPALWVITMPNCCKVEAVKRITPARDAVSTVFLNFALFLSSRSNIRITGMSEVAPSTNRNPLNANAPKNSDPARCATNANPHIIAVIRSNKVDLNCFNGFRPFYLLYKDCII